MKTIEIKGKLRTDLGKKATKALRKAGDVPCVLYGGKENVNFYSDVPSFKGLVYSPNVYIVNLDIDGKKYDAILKDLQFNPVSDALNHIDFYQISQDKEVEITVPIKTIGSSIGVKKGGKLSLAKRGLRIKALPKFLPDILEIDIEKLDVGESVKVGNLNFENITVLNGSREPVVSILASRLTAKAGAEEGGKK
jgi:large subunit ribosomal protein L25